MNASESAFCINLLANCCLGEDGNLRRNFATIKSCLIILAHSYCNVRSMTECLLGDGCGDGGRKRKVLARHARSAHERSFPLSLHAAKTFSSLLHSGDMTPSGPLFQNPLMLWLGNESRWSCPL